MLLDVGRLDSHRKESLGDLGKRVPGFCGEIFTLKKISQILAKDESQSPTSQPDLEKELEKQGIPVPILPENLEKPPEIAGVNKVPRISNFPKDNFRRSDRSSTHLWQ